MNDIKYIFHVGYKKPGGRKMRWVLVSANSERAAADKADLLIYQRYPTEKWLRYAGPLNQGIDN